MSRHELMVCGSAGVGKSALVLRYALGRFVEEYDPTIEDNFSKETIVDGEECLLEILDTVGWEDRCLYVPDSYIKKTEGFLILYTINSRSSFLETAGIKDLILRNKRRDRVPIVLVAARSDIPDRERQVTTEEGEEKAKSFGCPFVETSAKTDFNVDIAFHELVRKVRKHGRKDSEDSESKKKKDCLIQ